MGAPSRSLLLWAAVAFWASYVAGQDNATIEVEVRQGRLSGLEEEAEGRIFYSFRGIPYARPPVGDLRFKDPIAAEPWSGVWDGSVPGPVCPQLGTEGPDTVVRGNEDCLYLNVFTPGASPSGFPVLVWIPGGGFVSGGAPSYVPMPLLKRDVVLVVVQYRLGSLGFLSTEDVVLPGNLGLKDQLLALVWVRENISSFGGDPRRVTLGGQGAGAASAHFLVLSPYARGLFQRAILQSGNALSPWALRSDHRKVAAAAGQVFRCEGADDPSADLNSTALLECLTELPAEQLAAFPSAFQVWLNGPQVMTPRVDGFLLPAPPAVLLRDGEFSNVDIISGIVKDEGALPALVTIESPPLQEALEENFPEVAPVVLDVDEEKEAFYVARRGFNAYLPDFQIVEETAGAFAKLIGDSSFRVPHTEVLRLHARAGVRVFAYELKHRGNNSLTQLFNTSVGDTWVSNGDDLQYLFNGTILPPVNEPYDRRLSDIMVHLWTNFVATGHPTPNDYLGFLWTPVTSQGLCYLCLFPWPSMDMDRYISVYDFWARLPTAKNRVLYPQFSGYQHWWPKKAFTGRLLGGRKWMKLKKRRDEK